MACWFGVVILSPGALTGAWRTSVMDKHANGHRMMRWVDTVLPPDAVVLNGHRSMALLPREGVDYAWTGYVDPAVAKAEFYLERLKSKRVSHVLLAGPPKGDQPLAACFGRVVAGPGPGRVTTRNPFNNGGSYEAWVLEFDTSRLPGCSGN
jgi:hypothetical protein